MAGLPSRLCLYGFAKLWRPTAAATEGPAALPDLMAAAMPPTPKSSRKRIKTLLLLESAKPAKTRP